MAICDFLYCLSCTVFKLGPIIGQIFAIDMGVHHFNATAGGDDCMLLFDCPSVQNVAEKRKCKFMKKCAMSTNSICQLLAKMCV